jgi:hypothetical protein
VLGYIPFAPFLRLAGESLRPGGRLAFVVHKENSPREPLEIFAELVSENPSVLLKQVHFDFPPDTGKVQEALASAGLGIKRLWEGEVVFRYDTPREVLEHLLKSGAGTAYYEALDPSCRKALENEFLKRFEARKRPAGNYEVVHEYISCIAIQDGQKPEAGSRKGKE